MIMSQHLRTAYVKRLNSLKSKDYDKTNIINRANAAPARVGAGTERNDDVLDK